MHVCVFLAADRVMRLATIEQKRLQNVWMVRGGQTLTMSFHQPLFGPLGGGLLDDDVIAAAGNLLRLQFNLSINCFQAPSLPQKTRSSNQNINYQIHHMCVPLHWVLSRKEKKGEFTEVYDSASADFVPRSPEVLNDIFQVYGQTNVRVLTTQKQGPTVLCGDFSIFTAVELLTVGGDLSKIFDRTVIRQHLLQCLSNQIFIPCPKQYY